MGKQNYDNVAEEIGAMGADITVAEETTNLGKLHHAEAYGGKKELSADEQESLNEFMRKSRAREEKEEELTITNGWVPIDRESWANRARFYPEGWEFFVKPATVQAIRNWTSIDESRPDQVNRVFNEIIKMCVKIDTHDINGASWAQVNSWDRFWFITMVRKYTFMKGESKIEFDDTCENCAQDIRISLTPEALYYEFPDEDLINKYWNGESWYIEPTEYGVSHEPITLYTPKLGKDEAIINWAIAKSQAHQKVDETFIKFLPWMINKFSKDQSMMERQIQKAYNEYKSWDEDMFLFMDDVINNITINPSERLQIKCPHCGGVTTSSVQFPNGIKALFTREGTERKKFGSR